MDLKEFRNYQQNLILGGTLTVIAPTGQYDSSRLVNLGTNRWSVRPKLGASQAFGPLTMELSAAGPTFFTDNTNFLNGHTRSQDPIVSGQTHAIYDFGSGVWGSLDAQYWIGGSTTIDGQGNHDLQRNWPVGGTFAVPLSPNYSIKLFASTGVCARTNNNFDLVGICCNTAGARGSDASHRLVQMRLGLTGWRRRSSAPSAVLLDLPSPSVC
jgi:hypothetical protein